MSVVGICALGIVAAAAGFLLREWKSGAGAIGVTVAATCVILGVALAGYSDVIAGLAELADDGGIVSDTAALAVRALGVGFTAQIGADICRDLGEGSVASCIELAGRAEILLLCLPEFMGFAERAIEMLG